MEDCQRNGGRGWGIAYVKGNWRIRVKGQTERERERNIIKAEQLCKRGQEWRGKEKEGAGEGA